MDAAKMLQALPESSNEKFFLLLEGGAQTPESFQVFYREHASVMHSLYLHPQLIEARNYGPWLVAIKNKEELQRYCHSTPGLTAVIVSSRSGGALAVQLSAACTIISPDGKATLTRFYTRNVISLLAGLNQREWHGILFKGISQWWSPGEKEWQIIRIAPSVVINGRDTAIRLNNEEWQQLADNPVVGAVLTEWQKMPSSQHFPPCVQRDMVKKALNKASEAGMKMGKDQKLFALYYLNGGKKILESDAIQPALENVVKGKASLESVIIHYAQSQG